MLLLTSLAFGGSEAVEAYEHLAKDEEELLKHRAKALLQIPRDKRIPLLVQEIKRLVTQRRRQLASADPKRLAAVLKGERPSLVEVVLGAMPVELADATRAELGNPKTPKLVRDVKPEVLSVVRWKLEAAIKTNAPQVGSFRFTDLIMLQPREVFAVADRMGARVLATAVAGLEDAERGEFLGKLPPDQRALAARAAEAGAARRLTSKDAKLVLEMHGALNDPSLGMRSAGIQRIARACIAQSPEFAQRMVERHQGDVGRLLVRWIREERAKQIKGDGGRVDIVEQMERLAQKGIIDRPMRLPPPMRPPAPPPKPAAAAPAPRGPASSSSSKVLVSPPQRRPTGNVPRSSSSQGNPAHQPSSAPPGQRRDPIAEREARRAGASRPAGTPQHEPGARQTDARAQIMRDGKPLARNDALDTQPPRRQTSPVQPIPKRRDTASKSGSTTSPHRSPVLKGTSGRGPANGSS